MRAIEEAIDVTDEEKEQFRRDVLNYVAALSIEGRPFEYGTHERLHRGLAAYLYLQRRDD